MSGFTSAKDAVIVY